ncbi:hypothetical protein [Corynebacterium variabile]|uniref:Uncharacterized protein n=1 Tax=Corynebacterium variabile TaxID=1727 RepID=A0A4Y4C6D6_9CORY|nr:hypothetical protein [Corynebacterium variabile]GEC87442.1 hypothetical protein CVA01_27560 [Corynebacterium variabile]
MADRPGGRHLRGGILGLLDLLDDPDTCRAIERDLIGLNLRLRWLCDGTDRLNWRDLYVIITESDIDSALIRATEPDFAGWTRNTGLLADIFDVLAGANWQRAMDKTAEKPDPYPRPTARDAEPETINPDIGQSGRYVGEAAPIADIADWLGWDANLIPA